MQLWYSSLYFYVFIMGENSLKPMRWVTCHQAWYLSSISRIHRLSCDLFHASLHTYTHTHRQKCQVTRYEVMMRAGGHWFSWQARDGVHTRVWGQRWNSRAPQQCDADCKDHSRGCPIPVLGGPLWVIAFGSEQHSSQGAWMEQGGLVSILQQEHWGCRSRWRKRTSGLPSEPTGWFVACVLFCFETSPAAALMGTNN